MKKFKYVILLIAFIIVSTSFYCMTYKSDIRTSSLQQIEATEDIGVKLAYEIKQYCIENNITSVNELQGKIPYLGEKRLSELKKKFK